MTPDVLGHPLPFALRHPRRVLHRRRTVRESALAHRWLDGVEIGGAAHYDSGLRTLKSTAAPASTRHARGLRDAQDRSTLATFEELCNHLRLPVLDRLDPDDKTGNGFMVALDASAP